MAEKKKWIQRDRQRVVRCVLALFTMLCLVVVAGGRKKFYGEQTETAIGWNLDAGTKVIGGIEEETVLRQVFYPQDTILNYIYLGMEGHGQTGSLVLTVYDENEKEVVRREILCSELVEHGAQGVYIQKYVHPGRPYSYTISFRDVTDGYPEIQTANCISEGEIGALSISEKEQEWPIYGLFVYQSSFFQNLQWQMLAVVTALLLILLFAYPKLPVWKTRLLPLFVAGHSVLSVVLLEMAAGTQFQIWSGNKLFYNILLAFVLFTALSFFLWNGRALLTVGTTLCVVIGIAEYYILEFRGTPLVISDLKSIGTAFDVGGAYRFDITMAMISAVLILTGVLLLETKIQFVKYSLRERMAVLLLFVLLSTGSFVYLDRQNVSTTGKNGGFFWNMSGAYQRYGFLVGTYIYMNYQAVEKPEGYTKEAAAKILAEADALAEKNSSKAPEEKQKFPNIIAIMNESWTDFASVGGVETTEPVLPFIDSLQENTIRGSMAVSVFGAGTANTEFEFLTGNTTGFLPIGSIPYQAYIKKPLFSLASYLKEFDYTTFACHYAKAANWNREQVYPLLGFDSFEAIEDVRELEQIHGYPSDKENYRELIRNYEDWKEHGDTEHFFGFNVTIQNHGGYYSGWRRASNPQLAIGDMGGDVQEYLSLLQETDEAFEELVRYFEKEEEPTIILMFGDHWPRLNNDFISMLTSQAGKLGPLSRSQLKYTTPYLLWANYDIEEASPKKFSTNYLSLLLLKTAGLPLNGYQTFLDTVWQEVPVINTLGFADASGKNRSDVANLDPKVQELVQKYRCLQYANLFDGLAVGQ